MKKPEEKPIKRTDIKLHADAWTRFERAVGAAIKSEPKHRAVKKAKKKNKARKKKSDG